MAAGLRIHALDMGDRMYGDCLLVEGGGRTVLIDGGHDNDFQGQEGFESIPDQLEWLLGPLPFVVDLLIVTHVHADHIGCLPKMLEADLLRIDTSLVADEKLGFG